MLRIVNFDCELSCDEIVLENSDIESRKFYAITFIDSIKNHPDKFDKNNPTKILYDFMKENHLDHLTVK